VLNEARNLPISLVNLIDILSKESENLMSDEIETLYKMEYLAFKDNSNNAELSAGVRNEAAELARAMYEETPNMFDSEPNKAAGEKGNWIATASGFYVTDSETGHILDVSFSNGHYEGKVIMPDQGMSMPLEKWQRGTNPFTDNMCFKGRSVKDNWFFYIAPSTPFERIMAKVAALNE